MNKEELIIHESIRPILLDGWVADKLDLRRGYKYQLFRKEIPAATRTAAEPEKYLKVTLEVEEFQGKTLKLNTRIEEQLADGSWIQLRAFSFAVDALELQVNRLVSAWEALNQMATRFSRW